MTDVNNKILVSTVHDSIANSLKQLAQAEQTPLAAVASYALHYISYLEHALIAKVAPSEVAQARASAVTQVAEAIDVNVHPFTNPVDAFVTVKEKVDEATKEVGEAVAIGSNSESNVIDAIEEIATDINHAETAIKSSEAVL